MVSRRGFSTRGDQLLAGSVYQTQWKVQGRPERDHGNIRGTRSGERQERQPRCSRTKAGTVEDLVKYRQTKVAKGIPRDLTELRQWRGNCEAKSATAHCPPCSRQLLRCKIVKGPARRESLEGRREGTQETPIRYATLCDQLPGPSVITREAFRNPFPHHHQEVARQDDQIRGCRAVRTHPTFGQGVCATRRIPYGAPVAPPRLLKDLMPLQNGRPVT